MTAEKEEKLQKETVPELQSIRLLDSLKVENTTIVVMIVSSCVGLFVGGLLNNDMIGGMILFALISGIACIIHSLENRN